MLTKNEDIILSILFKQTATLSAKDIYKKSLLKFNSELSLSGLYIILNKLQNLNYITSTTKKGITNKPQKMFKNSKKGCAVFLESYVLSQKIFIDI